MPGSGGPGRSGLGPGGALAGQGRSVSVGGRPSGPGEEEVEAAMAGLGEAERRQILAVVERDVALEAGQRAREARLRSQLQLIKQRSALRPSAGRAALSARRRCGRCRQRLGFLLNPGRLCPKCRLRVCDDCLRLPTQLPAPKASGASAVSLSGPAALPQPLCSLCATSRDFLLVSGGWLQPKARLNTSASSTSALLLTTIRNVSIKQHQESNINDPQHAEEKPVKKRSRYREKLPSPKLGDIRHKALKMVGRGGRGGKESGDSAALGQAGSRHSSADPRLSEALAGPSAPASSASIRRHASIPAIALSADEPETSFPAHPAPPSASALPTSTSRLSASPQPTAKAPSKAKSMCNLGSEGVGSSSSPPESSSSAGGAKVEARLPGQTPYQKAGLLSPRTPSFASLASSLQSGVAVSGEVELALDYSCRLGALIVTVLRCRNLAAGNRKRQTSDPYVKLAILPDPAGLTKKKTHVKRHTRNPNFQEFIKYPSISKSELNQRTLVAAVWHSDLFGHNVFLGETRIPLGSFSWPKEPGTGMWFPLAERREAEVPPEDPPETELVCGELSLSLKVQPPDVTKGERSSGSLHVLLRSAQGLLPPASPSQGPLRPIVKAYLYPDKRRRTKLKSAVGEGQSPQWNHTLVYEAQTLDELREKCLELTLWDERRLQAKVFLGGVRLSAGSGLCQGKPVHWMDSTPQEANVWDSLVHLPNSWIQATLPLRPSMEPRF